MEALNQLFSGLNFVPILTGSREMTSGMRVSHQICILEKLFQQQSQVWIRDVRVKAEGSERRLS